MGTRGLTIVFLDREYKVAQYGQWDHYPTGQGEDICKFIRQDMNIEKFKQAIRECRFISQEEIVAKWKSQGADESGFVTMDISNKMKDTYPELSRDTGSKILQLIQNDGARELANELEFARDSLFCKYAYLLNLDTNELEVYRGFNKAPLSKEERFYFLGGVDGSDEVGDGAYHPIRLWVKIPFVDLKENTMKELAESEYEEDIEEE